jgi:hypothetical protein
MVRCGTYAGCDSVIFAVGDVICHIDAGRSAGLISWDTVAGPVSVKGPAGAVAWLNGDFKGVVESLNDPAARLTCRMLSALPIVRLSVRWRRANN